MQITEDNEIRALLGRVRRIAVVGLSSNAQRPSYGVARALQRYGYDIVPVNPNETVVLGEQAHAHLSQVPGTMDLVDVFRRSEHVPEIVEACIARNVAALWLQEGVVHEPAARRAVEAGIDVVMDRCIFKEHRRLLGG